MTILVKACVHSENFHVTDNYSKVTVDTQTVNLANSLVQWTVHSLSRDNRFFEVELLEDTTDNFYMIGTNVEGTNPILPLWNMYLSIRYNSSEGGVFTNGEGLKSDVPYGKTGDKVTVYLEDSFFDKSLINFFLNGRLVYRQWVNSRQGQLYPAVGVSKGPASFKVTWTGTDGKPSINMLSFHACLSNWIGFRFIEKDDTQQTLTITRHDDRPRLAYSVQAPRPFDHDNSYFEIEILTRLDAGIGPALGLTSPFTSKFQYPGWKPNTIGYHSDDGKFYNESGQSSSTGERGCLECGTGDKMGCGIVFNPVCELSHRVPQLVLIYFTKNGSIIYRKIRWLPAGGFYPTVGLFAVGESVRVNSLPIKPFIPPDYKLLFEKWQPVYRDFRFNEAFVFLDYEQTGSVNRLCLTEKQDSPRSIQCVRLYEDECFFKITISEIGENTEIHVGGALRTLKLRKSHLRTTPPTAIYLSRSQEGTVHVREGDTVCTCIKRDKPGVTSFNFLLNCKVGFRLDVKHNLTDFYYPSICVMNGKAKLHVVWTNDLGISEEEMETTLNGGCHAADEETLAKLLHGDRELMPENNQESSHANNDPVPGPALYEEMQPLRSKHGTPKKKGKSSACAVS